MRTVSGIAGENGGRAGMAAFVSNMARANWIGDLLIKSSVERKRGGSQSSYSSGSKPSGKKKKGKQKFPHCAKPTIRVADIEPKWETAERTRLSSSALFYSDGLTFIFSSCLRLYVCRLAFYLFSSFPFRILLFSRGGRSQPNRTRAGKKKRLLTSLRSRGCVVE